MTINYKPLFDKIMEDPDIVPEDGVSKRNLALQMAIQRATQTINNFKALNLTQDTPKFNKASFIEDLIFSMLTKAKKYNTERFSENLEKALENNGFQRNHVFRSIVRSMTKSVPKIRPKCIQT